MTINKLMFAYVIIIMIAFTFTVNAYASELQDGKATFYLPTGNKTATGTTPTEHLTVASDKKYTGMTVGIYYECENELVFVGYFECQDTGSKVNGNHFDIFVESLDTECEPFRFLIEDRNRDNRKIKFILLDAVG